MISYYELLGMIKEGNIPNKIKVHLTPVSSRNYISEYDIDESFSYYRLDEKEEEEEDENYSDYLAECFLESSMFDETIEILDEKGIDKLNLDKEKLKGRETPRAIDYLIESKINEIIDVLNKEE